MAQNVENVRSYVACKALGAIEVNGIADEVSWQSIPFSEPFVDIEGLKTPKYETKIKMLWDEDYFYVFAELEEPHVWGNLKQRDTVIFYNNDFEVFIDPDGDTHNYYELEVNSLNTQWDLFLTKPYRNGTKVLDSWDIQGLKTAINVNGTLNNPNDKDVGWSVEIAIPWKVITEAARSGDVPINQCWRVNFSRVNWDFDIKNGKYYRKKDGTGKYLHEYNWVWSPQGVINMHEPERWGYVFFSENIAGERLSEFKLPKDELIKWELYSWYRNLHSNFSSNLPNYVEVADKKVRLQLEKHATGWNLWCESPFTEKKIGIKEDGQFFIKK